MPITTTPVRQEMVAQCDCCCHCRPLHADGGLGRCVLLRQVARTRMEEGFFYAGNHGVPPAGTRRPTERRSRRVPRRVHLHHQRRGSAAPRHRRGHRPIPSRSNASGISTSGLLAPAGRSIVDDVERKYVW